MSFSRMLSQFFLPRSTIATRAFRGTPPTLVRAIRTVFTSTSPPSNRVLGVAAALKARDDPGYQVKPQILDEFSIPGGVAVITGANGGLGLEMSVALAEAGCHHVYCLDLPSKPSSDVQASQAYVAKFGSQLHYLSADVTDKPGITETIVGIAKKHGRLDVSVAAAGVLGVASGQHCTEYSESEWRKVIDINLTGVFFTSSAAAQGMLETKTPSGSIIMIASMSGSITNRGHAWVAYNSSKSGVLQLARSMACELGKDNIRVNTISPGHIYTKMTAALLDVEPEMGKKWETSNPLGRLGQVHEVRGVVTWLASSASSFCTGSDILVTGGHHAW